MSEEGCEVIGLIRERRAHGQAESPLLSRAVLALPLVESQTRYRRAISTKRVRCDTLDDGDLSARRRVRLGRRRERETERKGDARKKNEGGRSIFLSLVTSRSLLRYCGRRRRRDVALFSSFSENVDARMWVVPSHLVPRAFRSGPPCEPNLRQYLTQTR